MIQQSAHNTSLGLMQGTGWWNILLPSCTLQVKDVIHENINKVAERGENLNDLKDRTGVSMGV